MKKYFLSLVAIAAAMLFATSCQESLVEPQLGGTTTFTVQVPDQMGTKAIGEASSVNKLYVQVYPSDVTKNLVFQTTADVVDGLADVELNLIQDQSYDIIFWAQNGNAYTTADLRSIPMDKKYHNDDEGAAFYAYMNNFTPNGVSNQVTLTRPFAQLNLGTTAESLETNAGEVTLSRSYIKVGKVATSFNTVLGQGEGEQTVLFELKAVPTETLTVKVNGVDVSYKYISMDYLAVSSDKKAVVDIEALIETTKGNISHEFTSVPVQKNYRTNIIGNLISSTTDFIVEVNDNWAGDYTEEYVAPGIRLVNGVYEITSEEGLWSFAELVNGGTKAGGKSFEGKTVKLTCDIDLENEPWTPIGEFYGTFDGNEKTIKNLNVTAVKQAALFASVHGDIENLKIDGASINAKGRSAAIVGYLYGNVRNCEVNNAEITLSVSENDDEFYDGDKAGALVGYLAESGKGYEISGNKASNITITGYRDLGGLVGAAHHSNISGNTIDNVVITVDNSKNYSSPSENFGPFVGRMINSYGEVILSDNSGEDTYTLIKLVAEGIGKISENKYAITSAAGLASLSALIAADDKNFEGKTIVLTEDIDLFQGYMSDGDPVSTEPIGSTGEYDDRGRLVCEPFKGTFDGQGHVIKNIYQNGYLWKYWFGQYGSIGLFSELESATVKNLKIENFEARVEGGDIAFITGSATGDCVFENIEITNSRIATFNNGIGGIIGWSGAGNYTFKNIKLDESTTIGGFQQSFDASVGGIVGQAEPGATYNFENIEISCCLNVFNDVTASWQYYLYRMCGMIIGRCEETTTINGANYPDLSKYNLTFNNVVVNYGDWMNYHYCQGPYGTKGTGARVEPGFLYGGLDINATDHNDTCTEHMQLIPFDQLIGGAQIGVRGLREVEGVTVNYPASYRREVSTAAALTEALGKGVSVILDSDIDFGSNQLAITGENQVVDLNGHALTTANNWGGISLKNGATIKNGTITHAGNTAAIKAFNGSIVENVTINATCATADKTVTGIAVQQGANVESIKNVTINGVSQGIEVGYQATVGLIEKAVVNELNNGTAKGIGLVINGGKVGKAKDCTFKGETYGITMHLKGVFAVGLELENCKVEGTTASIYAWDEKGVSNTSGSLVLTYDQTTTLIGPFVWDFEDECQSVVTLNRPQ